jgi:starvation-inducible outer membrane lipoprotein
MKFFVLSALLLLASCATVPPAADSETASSGPTIYGQVSVSVDHVSTD